ncbi:MAG: class I SAM-dependent methyltransferase [Microthrixaceae bacterium]
MDRADARRDHEPGFDAGTYGRSFADVYDEWYPAGPHTEAAVSFLLELTAAPSAGRLLELGVGTGRLALPLAAAGRQVVGLDSSPEMLALLDTKSAGAVHAVEGDLADPGAWPEGPFDAVVAAFNLVCNVADAAAQRSVFTSAARVLSPTGALVVEAVLPAPWDGVERRLEVRSVTAESVVLIATEADPSDGVVLGQHIELRDGEPVRLRPWRIRVARPEELDAWAADAGLVLAGRRADWEGSPYDPHGAGHVSVYRLA